MQLAAPSLYYLNHFHRALAWLAQTPTPVISRHDQTFIDEFLSLPLAAQALWVRLTLRQPAHFRRSKLDYSEIESIDDAIADLLNRQWISVSHPLTGYELYTLLSKAECDQQFGHQPLKRDHLPKFSKQPDQPFSQACTIDDQIITHLSRDQADRLRLAFFGNLHQDWSEFVLQDLGVRHFLAGSDTPASGFVSAQEFEACWQLEQIEIERLEDSLAPLQRLLKIPACGPTVARRQANALFQIARQFERQQAHGLAKLIYQHLVHPKSRIRLIRVLETLDPTQAYRLARQVQGFPQTTAEQAAVRPALNRLRRVLGLPHQPTSRYLPTEREINVAQGHESIEQRSAQAIKSPGCEVWHTENRLFRLLWRLHYWPVLNAPVDGAFFNPFQHEPADLSAPDFREKRTHCWPKQIDYAQWMTRFLDWPEATRAGFTPQQLDQILTCIPRNHLQTIFDRIWQDPKAHLHGFPDLIQLDPVQGQYALIEVKGPGDALQVHQRQWLEYFDQHGIPAWVCHAKPIAHAI